MVQVIYTALFLPQTTKLNSFRQIVLLIALFFKTAVFGQLQDTLPVPAADTSGKPKLTSPVHTGQTTFSADTIQKMDTIAGQIRDSLLPQNTIQQPIIDSTNRSKNNSPQLRQSGLKKFQGQEILFYALAGILVFYAFMRLAFSKYFSDLLRVYFRTTLKQTQMREQMLLNPVPSLLLNVFFIITGGMYTAFLIQHFNLTVKNNFWQLWLAVSALLSGIYLLKFIGVKLAGWLFNRHEAAGAYTVIVFMTNKILGIVVLPFLVLLAFGNTKVYEGALLISAVLVSCIFVYRLYLTLGVVRGQLKVQPVQFLLYLAAFEIVPLLILFKLVMKFLN
jgi:hypothetical protein